MTEKAAHPSHKPTPKVFASWLAPLRNTSSVFATTPSTSSRFPAYAPASASILFPAFRFAAERRDSLVRLKLVRCPHSLAPTLVALPSMSLGPPLHSPASRTPAVLLYLGILPMRSTVALMALPAMSFTSFTPLFNDCRGLSLSR